MAHERFNQPSLPEALSDVVSDLAELFQKELRLARAELSSNISTKIRGGIWLGIAGLLGLLALILILGALVAWIVTFGVSLHLAFLIVAAGVAVIAVLAYYAGRSEAGAEIAPARTMNQVRQDIETAKEQLT
jgi:uncharacterized membrane protein YqjE